jgi:hypothetical protein
MKFGFENIILFSEKYFIKYHFEIHSQASFERQSLANKTHLLFIPLQASLHKFE